LVNHSLLKNVKKQCLKLNNLNLFFCSTLSEFENFLLLERILINVTSCQNETPLKRSFHSPTRAKKTQFTQELVK
jgi:hypothetical protein